MTDSIGRAFLSNAVSTFRKQKKLADGAIAQTSDEAFFRAPDAETNSIAIVVKHMAGNMRSRWSDFLTTDGEKPDRDRDSEFAIDEPSRDDLLARWEAGWQTLFDAIEPLGEEDLPREVTIRGEPHTVLEAIVRQLDHYAYHTGQIVYAAKLFRSSDWQTLSVARGGTAAFNREMFEKHAKR
jgi:hypothetical protein